MSHWRAEVDLPASLLAPRMGREIVGAALRGWGRPDLVSDATTVVSELVTNAVQHAPGFESYQLVVELRPPGVRISLIDGSSITPIVRELDRDEPRGRGMVIVQSMAADWGSDQHDGGKRVWVDIGTAAAEQAEPPDGTESAPLVS